MLPGFPGLTFKDLISPKQPTDSLAFHLRVTGYRLRVTQFYYFARNGIYHGLKAFGIKPGDEILMPELNSTIEVQVVRALGAIPVFYKIVVSDPSFQVTGYTLHVTRYTLPEFTPDWSDVRSKLTSRTKFFYLIHYLGVPNDIDTSLEFCKTHNLIFFEDAAFGFLSNHALRVTRYALPRPLGSFGDLAIITLRKTVPIPHGGVLIINKSTSLYSSHHDSPNLPKSNYPLLHYLFSSVHDIFWQLALGSRHFSKFLRTLLRIVRVTGRLVGLAYINPGSGNFDISHINLPMSRISHFLLERFDYSSIIQKMVENYSTAQKESKKYNLSIFPAEIQEATVPNEILIFLKDEKTRDHIHDALNNIGIEVGKLWYWNENLSLKNTIPSVRRVVSEAITFPIHFRLSPHQIQDAFDHLVQEIQKTSKAS